MRRLLFSGITNMRDLGYYSTIDGKETKPLVFIRSNIPYDLNEDIINNFHDINVTDIIDLRYPWEVNKKKNSFDRNDFNYHLIPLNGSKLPVIEEAIPKGYLNIIDNYDDMKKVFRVLINSKGSVIFNCTQGKDRTGVIAMLLLMLVKVPKEDIIADYSQSYIYLKDEITRKSESNKDIPYFVWESKPKYMEQTINMFLEKYKSIDKYMKILNFNDNDINRLKSKFLK